jgi:hypothetical protein
MRSIAHNQAGSSILSVLITLGVISISVVTMVNVITNYLEVREDLANQLIFREVRSIVISKTSLASRVHLAKWCQDYNYSPINPRYQKAFDSAAEIFGSGLNQSSINTLNSLSFNGLMQNQSLGGLLIFGRPQTFNKVTSGGDFTDYNAAVDRCNVYASMNGLSPRPNDYHFNFCYEFGAKQEQGIENLSRNSLHKADGGLVEGRLEFVDLGNFQTMPCNQIGYNTRGGVLVKSQIFWKSVKKGRKIIDVFALAN